MQYCDIGAGEAGSDIDREGGGREKLQEGGRGFTGVFPCFLGHSEGYRQWVRALVISFGY